MRFSKSRPNLAIDLGPRYLRAVQIARRPGRRPGVVASLFERVPEECDNAAAEMLGKRLAQGLRRAGLTAGPAIFAVPRSSLSIRRIDLPPATDDELPEMVHLAVERDLPIDRADAIIDFTVVERGSDGLAVDVVVASAREIDRIRDVARAADIPVARISPRCHGAVRFADGSDPTLLVDVTGEGLELTLVDRGIQIWSRGVAIPVTSDEPPTADQLVPETRRSWISYRLTDNQIEDPHLVVFGGERVADCYEALGEATGLDAVRFTGKGLVDTKRDMQGIWPLVGLLLPESRERTIDLASPRRTPDLAARWRQRMLAGFGLAIIAFGAGWTVGNLGLAEFSSEVAGLRDKADPALDEHLRFKRDRLRVGHLEAWSAIRPDWLEHLSVAATPRADGLSVVLDEFGGGLSVEDAVFQKPDRFTVDAAVRLTVEGEAERRDEAASVRQWLVEDDRYVLRNTTADTAGGRRYRFPFAFILDSSILDPGPPPVVVEIEPDPEPAS